MKAWIVDDEHPCIDELSWLLKQYSDLEVTGTFTDPFSALAMIPDHSPDVVFLDIDMPKMDGIQLALILQEHSPGLIVIFVTAYAQYALEAYRTHPLDFLLKPVRQTRLDDCISHLRKQYSLLNPNNSERSTLSIRCFGAFEILCHQEIKWATYRVRELFLYLIIRNGSPSLKEDLLNALFNGRNDKNTIHNLYMTIYRFKSLLETLDPQENRIRLTESNCLQIAPGICDYTDFMNFARENSLISEKNYQEAALILKLNRGVLIERESFEWANQYSMEAEAEYERISLDLSGFYLAAERYTEAEAVIAELLNRNALCEEAHTLFLDLALESGNREAYQIRYQQYARILKKELHLKPAAYYREWYEKFKKSLQGGEVVFSRLT